MSYWTGRPPIQRVGSWKTAVPLVVVHPNAEVGVARVDRRPSDFPSGEQEGPIMVPVKRSNDDGGFTGMQIGLVTELLRLAPFKVLLPQVCLG